MNKAEFVRQLEYLLQDIPEDERQEAIFYYRAYLEDAGEENEEQVILEFGSPERVAAIIRSDLNGNLKEGGEFTESGYQDAFGSYVRDSVGSWRRSAGICSRSILSYGVFDCLYRSTYGNVVY